MILDILVILVAVASIYIASSGYCVKRRRRDNQVLTLTIIASVMLILNQSSWLIGYHLLGNVDQTILSIRSGIEIIFIIALSLFGFKR